MDNSSGNHDNWCGPGVTALITGAMVGAASYFGSRFFAPQLTDQERQEQKKYREALLEYEQQLLLDLPEREEIIETLNTLFDKFDNYCNAFNLINSKIRMQSNSKIEMKSELEFSKKVIKTEYQNHDLAEKVSQLNLMINSYPSIKYGIKKTSFEIEYVCQKRIDHHQQVKERALFIFEQIQLLERDTEKCLEAQKDYLPVTVCRF